MKDLGIYRDIPSLLDFLIRALIWDIPVLVCAYVLFWGPKSGYKRPNSSRKWL